jgi:hypothetical protein
MSAAYSAANAVPAFLAADPLNHDIHDRVDLQVQPWAEALGTIKGTASPLKLLTIR